MERGIIDSPQLSRFCLVEVVAGRIRDGYCMFFETINPCLVMIDCDGRPVLWANGLRKIPFKFINHSDFQKFCDEVAYKAGMCAFSGTPARSAGYFPFERAMKFRNYQNPSKEAGAEKTNKKRGERNFEILMPRRCETCGGYGKRLDSHEEICPTCGYPSPSYIDMLKDEGFFCD